MDKYLKEYRKDGFTKVEGFYGPQELEEIKKEVAKFVEIKAKLLSGRDINFTQNDLNSIHRLWDEGEQNFFYKKAASERILKFIKPFLDDEPEIRGSELFLKPAHEGLASPSHQDDFYWCIEDANALTCWTALVDCDAGNGGIYYYTGSHKIGLLPHVDSFAPGSSQKIEDHFDFSKHEKVLPSLKAGDMLIHHALTVHGSGANLSDRSRRGWTIQYKGKNSNYDLVRKHHYLDRLAAQIESRKNK